jgi:hypothetical protein
MIPTESKHYSSLCQGARTKLLPRFLASIRKLGFKVGLQDLNHEIGSTMTAEFRQRAKLINQYAAEYGANEFGAAALYRKPD